MSYFKQYTPIKTNPWLALQESKRHFREQAAIEVDLLDQLVAEQDQIIDQGIEKTVVGASGRVYKFIKVANSTNLEIQYKGINEDGTSYLDTVSDTVTGYFAGTGLGGINNILPNIGLGISAILSDISNGEGFNTTMANLCNAFQGANELSYSDVYAVFNEKGNILKEDKTSLLDMVKSILKKGRINSYSWITLLSKLLSTTKAETDEDNLLLDKTKPFILQSMVAYALLQVVPMTIGAICFSISKTIGAILYLILSVVSSIFSAISKAMSTSTTAEVDDESLTDYVKGPLIYSTTDSSVWRNYHSKVFNYDLSSEDGFIFMPLGPIHLYEWKGEKWSDPLYMNGFWSIGWDWRKVLLDMSSDKYYTYNETGSLAITTRLIFDLNRAAVSEYYNSSDYYLSVDKVKEILMDPDKVLYEMYFGMMVWLFIANYAADAQNNFVSISCGSHFSNNYDYFRQVGLNKVGANEQPLSVFSRGVVTNVGNILYTLVNLPSTVTREDFLYDLGAMNDNMYDLFLSHHDINDLVRLVQDVYQNVVSVRGTMDRAPSMAENGVETLAGHDGNNYECNACFTDSFTSTSTPPYFYSEIITSQQTNSMLRNICYDVDSLPIDRGITIPSTSSEKLIAAITLVAVVSAAVVAVTVAAKRALKLRALDRKTTRAVNLNNLKEIYSDDPMDESKKNLYLSEVRKYNIKASLFGWGTYDPANGWFNDSVSSSDSTTTALLLGSNGDLLPNLMKDTSLSISGGDGQTPAVTLSRLSNENSISQDKVDTVIALIRGA